MNTIETIRAEIERRMRKVHETSFNMEMKDLLSILDTLQEKSKKPINPTLQEQPVCEGEEEEYEQIKQKVCSECPSHKDDYCGYVKRKLQRKCNYLSDVMYGYELGRQSKPKVSEGLEEEYQQFCKDYPFPWSSQFVNREYIDELCLGVAHHFAQWQKEQMMKEAVDVTFKSGTMRVNGVETPFEGGKAKLIIIKKD